MKYLANSEVISSAFAFTFVLVPNACCTSKSRARSRSHSASLNSRESENPLGGRNFMVSSRLTSLSELIKNKVWRKRLEFLQFNQKLRNFLINFVQNPKVDKNTHKKVTQFDSVCSIRYLNYLLLLCIISSDSLVLCRFWSLFKCLGVLLLRSLTGEISFDSVLESGRKSSRECFMGIR